MRSIALPEFRMTFRLLACLSRIVFVSRYPSVALHFVSPRSSSLDPMESHLVSHVLNWSQLIRVILILFLSSISCALVGWAWMISFCCGVCSWCMLLRITVVQLIAWAFLHPDTLHVTLHRVAWLELAELHSIRYDLSFFNLMSCVASMPFAHFNAFHKFT